MQFETKRAAAMPDAIAPDGSEVRILCGLKSRRSGAVFLPPGVIAKAVAHRSVEELWYVVAGRGRMWRKLGAQEEIVDLDAGCLAQRPDRHVFPIPLRRAEGADDHRGDDAALAWCRRSLLRSKGFGRPRCRRSCKSRRPRCNPRLQKMAAAHRLGAQIALVVPVGREDMRHPLGDADAVAFERRDFLGIIGQQTDHAKTQLPQHVRGRQIDPFVGVETQLFVGVERVETGVLQSIGAQLIDEPDAAPLLREIE